MERISLTGHRREVNVLAVAPDGTWLASGSGDRTVRIWDVMTGAELHTLRGHKGDIEAVAIAPTVNGLQPGASTLPCVSGTLRERRHNHMRPVTAAALRDLPFLRTGDGLRRSVPTTRYGSGTKMAVGSSQLCGSMAMRTSVPGYLTAAGSLSQAQQASTYSTSLSRLKLRRRVA